MVKVPNPPPSKRNPPVNELRKGVTPKPTLAPKKQPLPPAPPPRKMEMMQKRPSEQMLATQARDRLV